MKKLINGIQILVGGIVGLLANQYNWRLIFSLLVTLVLSMAIRKIIEGGVEILLNFRNKSINIKAKDILDQLEERINSDRQYSEKLFGEDDDHSLFHDGKITAYDHVLSDINWLRRQ